MAKFRKKPIAIDAWQNTDEVPFPSWVDEADCGREPGGVILVLVLHGLLIARAKPGDWLVKETDGEVYVYEPDNFAALYEPVED